MTIRRLLETETRHEMDSGQRLDMIALSIYSTYDIDLLDCFDSIVLGCVISGCARGRKLKRNNSNDVYSLGSHVMDIT